jgi:NADH-quinone oxidoreductase subunit N
MVLNLTVPGDLALALLPEILLFTGAMVLLVVAAVLGDGQRTQRLVGIGAVAVATIAVAAVLFVAGSGWTTSGGPIALDPFRFAVALVVLLGTIGSIGLSIEDNAREGVGVGETHILTLFASGGMMVMGAARDLMVLFLAIEIMSLSAYILAGINRRSARSAESALKYFLLGAFSTAFLLFGIAVVFGVTGHTGLAEIGRAVSEGLGASIPLLHIGIGLLLIGFLFKVSAAPFHMWAPDVYDGAPTAITAYMAATVKTASFAAFLRVWTEAFPSSIEQWRGPLMVIAVLTMIVGSVVAIPQQNIKRMLAYSSIVHSGYLLIAALANSALGRSALLFYLVSYTLATLGAFAVVSAVSKPTSGRTAMSDYAGLWHERPWLAMAMAVYMFALLGFPIFGGSGFIAKWYMLEAALTGPTRMVGVAVAVVLTSAISAGFYLSLVMVMFMKQRPGDAPSVVPTGPFTRIVIAGTSLGILVLGIAAAPLISWAERGAALESSPPTASTLLEAR